MIGVFCLPAGLPLLAGLVVGRPQWVWIAAGITGVASVLLLAGYLRVSWPVRRKWAAGLLKVAAFLLLAVCLFEPLWSGTTAAPGENLVLLVADQSGSLSIGDGPQGAPRGEEFVALLEEQPDSWLVRLAQDFRVLRFTAGRRLEAAQSLEQLSFQVAPTGLAGALSTLFERFERQPVAAILLFTDGAATDAFDFSDPRWVSGPPVYPVLPTTPTEIRDVSIVRVAMTQSSFEDAPVMIQADVTSVGEAAEVPIRVQLLNAEGELVEEQSQPSPAGRESLPFRFHVRPEKPLTTYRVRTIAGESFDGYGEAGGEATWGNNERLVMVERKPGPYRVLYVGGRPNWEFKFLRRALSEDPDVRLVALLRIANKEGKFEFLGRAGESTNPLFRGFKTDEASELESYDEAVMLSLGVEGTEELPGGKFPRSKKDLFRYEALILDDVEAAFFTHDQQELIDRFVSERGGGLLMLGGPRSFHQGGWHRSPVRNALPVYIERPQAAVPFELDRPREWRFQLSRDGWLQPWVRLRDNEQDERTRLEEMSGFRVVSRVDGAKPAAQVLANVVDANGSRHPALIAHDYGSGRAAALLVGDLWRWSLGRDVDAPDDLAKSWRQTVRWLVADVPRRVEVSHNWIRAGESDAVALRVHVRDEEYEPLENASVTIRITAPGEEPLPLTAEPSLESPGVFTTTYVPRTEGAYTAAVEVTGADGKTVSSTETGWTFQPSVDEFAELEVNRALMETLAEATGGRVLSPDEVKTFASSLPGEEVPIQQVQSTPLWHSPWVLAVILACLAGEWGLRRWRGLP